MEEYIAFDSHKHYTWVEHQQANSGKTRQYRLEHAPGAIRQALMGCSPGTPVAIEATANWYWITDEIEQARCVPRLVHPRRAKLMMGQINKTDKLDTHGLNMLQRNGTLPTVWIPPGPLRGRIASRLHWRNGACQPASTAIRMEKARAKNCRGAWSSCRSRRAGPHSRC